MSDSRALIRTRGRGLRTVTTLVLAATSGLIGWELVVACRSARPGFAIAFLLTYQLPTLIYLWAIWTVRRAFGELAAGALFGNVVPMLLRRVGLALAAGGIVAVAGSPLLLHLIFPSRWTAVGNFDPAAITLSLIGVLLTLLSRLLDEAREVSAELDGIF